MKDLLKERPPKEEYSQGKLRVVKVPPAAYSSKLSSSSGAKEPEALLAIHGFVRLWYGKMRATTGWQSFIDTTKQLKMDVYKGRYDSSALAPWSPQISKIGDGLCNLFKEKESMGNPLKGKVIHVGAHSMGGLAVLDALTKLSSEELRNCNFGRIMFIGVPFEGAPSAEKLGKYLHHRQARDLTPGSIFLRSLHQRIDERLDDLKALDIHVALSNNDERASNDAITRFAEKLSLPNNKIHHHDEFEHTPLLQPAAEDLARLLTKTPQRTGSSQSRYSALSEIRTIQAGR